MRAMIQRLREIVEAEWRSAFEAEGDAAPEQPWVEREFAERVARRVTNEILGICDEGIAFQLNIKDYDRREWNAGIIRYLRGQIVRHFGLGDGDE